MLTALDHVNLHTDDLEGMTEWYKTVLGLVPGPRPAFSIPGVWLYLDDLPVVHLVHCDAPLAKATVSLEHFAFRATGMAGFEKKLSEMGITHDIQEVPGTDILQVNVHDPMGNHLHIDFEKGK